jgi:hypothetical protein
MPEMQTTDASLAGLPAALAAAAPAEADFDYALGCECADPALQIERWSIEALPPAGAAN